MLCKFLQPSKGFCYESNNLCLEGFLFFRKSPTQFGKVMMDDELEKDTSLMHKFRYEREKNVILGKEISWLIIMLRR